MKTIKQIEADIKNIESEIRENLKEHKSAKIKKLKADIEIKKQCILYLEHNPTQEFVEKEIARLNALIVSYLDPKRIARYCNDYTLPNNNKTLAKYKNFVGIKGYKEQLSVLNYIKS